MKQMMRMVDKCNMVFPSFVSTELLDILFIYLKIAKTRTMFHEIAKLSEKISDDMTQQ